MAKTWDEKLADLSVKLAELSKKTADASEDAKAYRELRQEAIKDKISTVKGDVAAMQENARIEEEEREGKIKSALLRARMTVKAKHDPEDLFQALFTVFSQVVKGNADIQLIPVGNIIK